jgi:addiction module HigA family antidote
MTFRWQGMPMKSVSKVRNPNWLGPVIPPGEILLEEFLRPSGLSLVDAAERLGVSLNQLNEIVLSRCAIRADTALRLAREFKTSIQFWTGLQADWELKTVDPNASTTCAPR